MIKKLLTISLYIFAIAVFPSYALAASLSLSPASGTFNKGCSFNLDIKLDTGGIQTYGTDTYVLYDNTKLTATTPTSGKLYADDAGINVYDQEGRITFSGVSASESSPFSGVGTLTTLHFTVKDAAGTGATMIRFDFDASDKTKTTDSNVIQNNPVTDILSSVTNGNYTIGIGACTSGGATPAPAASSSVGGPGTIIVVPPSTPSAGVPYKEIPSKTLPDAGTQEFTYMIGIVGSVFVVLGILGLALL